MDLKKLLRKTYFCVRAYALRLQGKGDFFHLTDQRWSGRMDGWDFEIDDGFAVRFLNGPQSTPKDCGKRAWNAIVKHLDSKPLAEYLEFFHNNCRVLTAPSLGLNSRTNKVIVSFGTQHGVTIGRTGSGKFACTIAPTCLFYRGAIIVIDPKGEVAMVTASARARLHGQIPVILDPFNMMGGRLPEHAELRTYNPLSEIEPLSATFYADSLSMADALLVSRSDKDPMWRNNAKDLLTGLIMLVCTDEEFEGQRDLGSVRAVLSSSSDEWRIVFNKMLSSANLEIQECGRRMEAMPEKTFGGVLSQCNSDLQFLSDPLMRRILSSNESSEPFQFRKFYENRFITGTGEEERKKLATKVPLSIFYNNTWWKDRALDAFASGGFSLYIVLPPHYLESHAGWLRAVLTSAINIATRKARKGVPTLMIVDEAFQLRQFELLPRAYSIMRGYNFRIWTFWQDLGQIKANYPDTWQSILGNSFQHLLGTRDLETAKYFSELAGMETKMVKTGYSTGTSYGTSAGGYSSSTNFSENMGRVVEPKIRPEQILGVSDDWGLAYVGDEPMFWFKKLRYFQHNHWNREADPNPYVA